jgi:hypothetical protein
MSFINEAIPALSDTLLPSVVRGTADLATFAYQGNGYEEMLARIGEVSDQAARLYDTAIAAQLAFRRADGLSLQDEALEASQVYRVGCAPEGALRLLALVSPGDLMTNTPLDFLTNHLNVRLDLLYVMPDRPLAAAIPDHDVAFFAVGEANPPEQERLRRLYARWPRPVLNDPAFLPAMERDTLSHSLSGIPGLCSCEAVAVVRPALEAHLLYGASIEGYDPSRELYPCLIRPLASHAGAGLARLENPADLARYLQSSFGQRFFLTPFEDYSSADGLFRKSRVAFIDRQPFLCHMAVSERWMVHYLNAGMTESAAKRAEEAHAMDTFEHGFARRHAVAFEALHERLAFDYYSIDCAETKDGRLLVFEADTAAIVHLMDPPDVFPYKQAPIRRVFAAFEEMLRRRAGEPR